MPKGKAPVSARDAVDVKVEAELDSCLALLMERGVMSEAQVDRVTDDLALGTKTPQMLLNDILPLLRLAGRGGGPKERGTACENVPQPAKRGFGPRRTDATSDSALAVQADCVLAKAPGASVMAEMEALLALAHEASGGACHIGGEYDLKAGFEAGVESVVVGVTALGIASLPSSCPAVPAVGGGVGETGDAGRLHTGEVQGAADGTCVAASDSVHGSNAELATKGIWGEDASSECGCDEGGFRGSARMVGSAGSLAIVLDVHYVQLAGSSFSLQTDWEVAALEEAIERRVGGVVTHRYACDSDPDPKHGEARHEICGA